jgi:hypothetical protein
MPALLLAASPAVMAPYALAVVPLLTASACSLASPRAASLRAPPLA